MDQRLVEIAYVARAHGVRGQLRVVLHNAASDALERAEVVYLGGVRYAVENTRAVHAAYLIKLEGIDDRDQAARAKGKRVCVERSALALQDDEILLIDLVGCRALDPEGRLLGHITDVRPAPAHPLLLLVDDTYEQWVPCVDALVPSIDLDARELTLDLPTGLPRTRRVPAPGKE